MNLTTKRAKWLWFLDRCRLRYWLAPLPRRVRRSIESELEEQAGETFSHLNQVDERARLEAVYRRRGDAEEYLPELVGQAAWTMIASRIAGLQSRALRPNLIAALSGSFLLQLFWFLVVCSAAFVFMLSVASVLWPANVGIFELQPDHYQLRLFSEPIDSERLFSPWLGLFPAAASGLGFKAALNGLSRAVLSALAVLRTRLTRDECE